MSNANMTNIFGRWSPTKKNETELLPAIEVELILPMPVCVKHTMLEGSDVYPKISRDVDYKTQRSTP